MASTIFAMPASSIALLFSVAFGVSNGLPWTGPEPTNVYDADEFSPKPTSLPNHAEMLFKRNTYIPVNVCGWIGGDKSKVNSCNVGSSCIHDSLHGYIGCCATAGPCTDGVYTTCVDETSNGWSSVQGMINNGVLTCESMTCYRNNFPDNYAQYKCGTTNAAADVQRTYLGQGPDVKLQRVYRAISFSPMPAPASTTESIPSQTNEPPAGTTDPSNGATPSAPAANDGGSDEKTGYIAGGTVGGIAFLAIVITAIVFLLRRRHKKNQLRVGGFVSLHQKDGLPPVSGPFQRIRPYSPEDFPANETTQRDIYISSPAQEPHDTTYVSPFTGHPDSSHQSPSQNAIDRDLLGATPLSSPNSQASFPATYETAMAVPISRLNKKHSPSNTQSGISLLNTEDQQTTGLFRNSEIEDFSRTWNQSVAGNQGYTVPGDPNQDRDTHIHSGDMPETTDMGLAGAVRRAASTLIGHGRAVDSNARSEAMRQADKENKAWSASQLMAAQQAESDPATLSKEQMIQAFNAATTRELAGSSVTPARYQLVDDGSADGGNELEVPGNGRGAAPK